MDTGVQTERHTNETGRYLFDYVEPGTYALTVQLDGFRTFVQANIAVESRGDVRVNAVLMTGTLQETVTVTDSPVAVQFNTTSTVLTVDTKLAHELPRFRPSPVQDCAVGPGSRQHAGRDAPVSLLGNDRINISLSRMLPNEIAADVTYVANFGHDLPYTRNPNQIDPRLWSEYKSALDASVPNRFFQYLTPQPLSRPAPESEHGCPQLPPAALSTLRRSVRPG